MPTGTELVRLYLEPLARHAAIAPHLRCRATVTAISRLGLDKATSAGREQTRFVVEWRGAEGKTERAHARAVIDAS